MNSGAQSVVVVDAMRSVASTLIEHGCRLGLASLLLFLIDVRTLDKEGRTHVCIFTFIALPLAVWSFFSFVQGKSWRFPQAGRPCVFSICPTTYWKVNHKMEQRYAVTY